MNSEETITQWLGTDAARWAQEFNRTIGGILDADPGSHLHGWFANAIEAGRMAGMADEARTGAYRAGMVAALGPDWAG